MSESCLFIIDGVSSVWKQDLVHYIDHVLVNAAVVRKLSTRAPRAAEDFNLLDLEHVERSTFAKVSPDYAYEYGGEEYGIQRTQLTAALNMYGSVFVIVRNSEIIRQIKRDFNKYRPISVFVHMDMRLAENRSLALKDPLVRQSVKNAFSDYLRDPESYDQVLVNGGSRNDFFRLLDVLIKRGVNRPLVLLNDKPDDLLLVSTSRQRRVAQFGFGALSAAALGFAVNMVTSGSLDYWGKVSLILDGMLLLITLMIQFILLKCWHERV